MVELLGQVSVVVGGVIGSIIGFVVIGGVFVLLVLPYAMLNWRRRKASHDELDPFAPVEDLRY